MNEGGFVLGWTHNSTTRLGHAVWTEWLRVMSYLIKCCNHSLFWKSQTTFYGVFWPYFDISKMIFENGSKCTSYYPRFWNLHISNDSNCTSDYITLEKILQLVYLSNGSKWTSDYPSWLEKKLKLAFLKRFICLRYMSKMSNFLQTSPAPNRQPPFSATNAIPR